jgi:hypothetical protein
MTDERLLSGHVPFSLANLPQCTGLSCGQGDHPCTDNCPNVPQRAAPPACDMSPNAGTFDPTMLAAPDDWEPATYEIGYVDGWRVGAGQALLMGVALGAALVGVAIQLGLVVGF